MLSFKVTYAIQILDLLRTSKNSISMSELRDRFSLLPSKTTISDIVHQLDAGRLICNTSLPGAVNRYRIMVGLNEITLSDVSRIVVGSKLVFGTPVCFPYWYPGYSESYPRIAEVEQQLENMVTEFMKSITIEEILAKQQEQSEQPGETEQKSQIVRTTPRKRRQRKILTAE